MIIPRRLGHQHKLKIKNRWFTIIIVAIIIVTIIRIIIGVAEICSSLLFYMYDHSKMPWSTT